jgi:hypothetical protein
MIPKGYSKAAIQRTDNTIAKKKRIKGIKGSLEPRITVDIHVINVSQQILLFRGVMETI